MFAIFSQANASGVMLTEAYERDILALESMSEAYIERERKKWQASHKNVTYDSFSLKLDNIELKNKVANLERQVTDARDKGKGPEIFPSR